MIPADVHAMHLTLGYRSGACDRCNPEPDAGPWWMQAAAGQLRPAIVGGVPVIPATATPRRASDPSCPPVAASGALRGAVPATRAA